MCPCVRGLWSHRNAGACAQLTAMHPEVAVKAVGFEGDVCVSM